MCEPAASPAFKKWGGPAKNHYKKNSTKTGNNVIFFLRKGKICFF